MDRAWVIGFCDGICIIGVAELTAFLFWEMFL
jgi:hypothetical protein